MANMTGFSVFQPAVGAALQWLPALGTQELDDMINAYLPGNASIQDKRAHVSVDFFMHSQQTGLNSKFYAVPPPFTTTTATSPASSAFYDSAYGSSFNASPVVSTMSPWTESTAVFTPSFSADEPKSKSKARSTTKKPAASSSRQSTVDFGSHPGMRIMTKDGRDVTNSASRGCKTKEQRDHAHLMRIIKACDSCKRKKIRCDPSHRKRTASQASSSSPQTESKPTKKLRKETTESPPVAFEVVPDFTPDFFASPETASASSSFESTPESADDLWTQFVAFDQEPEPLATNFNFTLDDFNFDSYIDPQTLLTPSLSDSSASPSQWFTPFSPTTPAPPGPSPPVVATESTSSDFLFNDSAQDLTVPYLNPGVPHGTSYQDFNLYSPPADFFLDEEPLPATKPSRPSGGQQSSPPSYTPNNAHVTFQRTSAPGTSSVVAPMQECCSSQQQPTAGGNKPRSRIIQNRDNIHITTSLTDSWCPDRPQDAARVHDGDGSPTLQSYGVPPLSSQHVSTQPSRSDPSSASIDVHGSSQQSGYLQSQRPSGTPTTVYASRSPAQTQPLLQSSSRGDQLATSLPSSSSSPAATNYRSFSPGRSLSADQQLQTLSTCTTATVASSRSLVVTQQQTNAMISPTMMATSESRHVNATSHLDVRPALQAYGQSEAGVLQGDMIGAQALVAAFATVLTTLPMRRLGGSDAKNELCGSLSLFHLVVFGLVSSLLVLGLQMHFLGQQGGFNTLVLASISLSSTLQSSRRPGSTPTPSGDHSVRLVPKPTPTSNGTIDNVKTKIQPLGYGFRNLQCAVSQQLRAFVPRFSSLNIML